MLLITALGGTLFYGCRSSQKPAAGPVRLPVAEVAVQDVPVRKSFVGQINGYRDITIQPRADGYLRSIHFREGSFVKKGTLLYTIETAPYAAQTAQSEASVSRAEAQLADARQTYERTKAMAAINAASRSDLDNATAQLLAAQASLRAAKAVLTSARIEQGYTRITSPVDGIIGRTLAQVGDFVGLNSKYNSLNTVSQVDSVKVLFFIPEQTYAVLMQQGGQLYDLTLSLSDNSVYPERGRRTIDRIARCPGDVRQSGHVVAPGPVRTGQRRYRHAPQRIVNPSGRRQSDTRRLQCLCPRTR